MTADEKLKEKFIKRRKRLEAQEFRISELVFKMTSQRRKLWRACPHKWENAMDKRGKEVGDREAYRICEVCGAIRTATIDEVCLDKL